jgi:hypothetical protein
LSNQPSTTATLIEYILKRYAGLPDGKIDITHGRHQSWAVEAARTGNIDMLHHVLDFVLGHLVDKDAGLIVSAYHTACEAGHMAMVRDFLDRGLAIANQDHTALLHNQGVIKLLVERGASARHQTVGRQPSTRRNFPYVVSSSSLSKRVFLSTLWKRLRL